MMSSTSSRKRGGKELSNEPEPKHRAPADANQPMHDVVIIVDEQKFKCMKKDLVNHSQYFRSIFFTNFEEIKKQVVELKTDHPEGIRFQLFIDAMEGLDTITDDNVQDALVVAAFLESSTLEKKCLDHLAVKSNFTMAEQIKLAEALNSTKLLEQTFSRIKNPLALEAAVPQNFDELSDKVKNMTLQKSFELLGLRKPPQPKIENHIEVFEKMIEQMQTQTAIVDQQGTALADQGDLLHCHFFNELISSSNAAVRNAIAGDPMISALMEDWLRAGNALEQNFIQAQIHVLKLKHVYHFGDNESRDRATDYFIYLPPIIARYSGDQFKRYDIYSGNRPADVYLNNILADVLANPPPEDIVNPRQQNIVNPRQQNRVNRRQQNNVNPQQQGIDQSRWMERIDDHGKLRFSTHLNRLDLHGQPDSFLQRKVDDGIQQVRQMFYKFPSITQPRQT